MQKRHLAAAALLATTVSFAVPSFAQDSSSASDETVVATVAGEPITQSELQSTVEKFQGQFGQMPEEQVRAIALSSLIDMKVIAEAAEKDGIDETEAFKTRMEELRQEELYNAFFDQKINSEITPEMLKERYDEEIANAPKQEEVHARHILVDSEEEAQDIIKQLDDGADFAELAEQHSTGPSASNGGDLGYFSKGQMVPEFEEAAFALEPGAYTETPVKTQFGYHVIEVEDMREKAPVPFEQIEPQLRQLIASEKYNEVVSKLKTDDKIVIEDKDLQEAYDNVNKMQ
ncbi:peptidylprolyl isomerase [Martelella mangrovi]|uniref:Parvulin-like PPIase n=1 Tax=Martelella mangrovi TaxID=1397477 RepID=A0ABV2I7A3_9HYPH|nr:peptidylprolyl isomerase [uncultured Martelella sp.]